MGSGIGTLGLIVVSLFIFSAAFIAIGSHLEDEMPVNDSAYGGAANLTSTSTVTIANILPYLAYGGAAFLGLIVIIAAVTKIAN
jgi:hypothetical protein